jgi:hypothetical protein
MIERTAILKTVEGDALPLPIESGADNFFEVKIQYAPIEKDGTARWSGYGSYASNMATLHVRRDTLAKAGLAYIQPPVTKEETPDQLAIRLLEMLGVKFQE